MPPNKKRFQPNSGGGGGGMNRSRGGGGLGYRGGGNKGRAGYGRGDRYNQGDGYGHSYGGGSSGDYGGRHGGQMLNPWESGVVPMANSGNVSHGGYMPHGGGGGGGGGSLLGEFRGSSDIVGSINHLSQMNNPESKLALNILNAVLSKDEGHQSGWNSGPPVNKRRRMDMDGGYDSHRGQTYAPPMHHQVQVHKFPQQDQQFGPRRAGNFASPRRGRGGRFIGQAGRQMTTQQQFRKTVTVKKGKPINNKGNAKVQKKKGETASGAATGTAGGQKGDKTEGGGSSATADPKQSDEAEKEAGSGEENAAEGEAGKDDQKTDDKTSKKVVKDHSTPKEALRCHFCQFYKFTSIKSFRNHLESKNHEQMERSFHMKGVSILQFLRAQSKLAAQRNLMKLRRKGTNGRIMKCTKCQCPFMGSLAEHTKTREHSMVSNYTKCSPCRLWFENRIELEKHRLSFLHLTRQATIDQNRLEKAMKAKKPEEAKIPEHETLKKLHVAVERLRLNQRHTNVFSTNQIPIYDPGTPIGMNFIFKKSLYYCTVCSSKSIPFANETLAHFSSQQHYDNYVAHLKAVEEKKRLEKAKQEEKKKEEEENEQKNKDNEQKNKDNEQKNKENEQKNKENKDEDKDVEEMDQDETDQDETAPKDQTNEEVEDVDVKEEEVDVKEEEEPEDVEMVDEELITPVTEVKEKEEICDKNVTEEKVEESQEPEEENKIPEPVEAKKTSEKEVTNDSVDEAPVKEEVAEEVKPPEVVATPRGRRGRGGRGRGRGVKK
ncbi:uncharacterized abhydrolase domain-containing protein DDB_G0269086-like [Homarus americanus]|nr:uncharacterized abhydrolase domain-containing protein DDB_G0269086-like [Homarus americanus]